MSSSMSLGASASHIASIGTALLKCRYDTCMCLYACTNNSTATVLVAAAAAVAVSYSVNAHTAAFTLAQQTTHSSCASSAISESAVRLDLAQQHQLQHTQSPYNDALH
jgi:hypothetical protein